MKKIIPLALGLAGGCQQPEPVEIQKAEDAVCSSDKTLMDVAYETNAEIAEHIDKVLEENDDYTDPLLDVIVERSEVEASEDVKNSLPGEYQWFGLVSPFEASEKFELYGQLGYEDRSYRWSFPKEKITCSDSTFAVTLEEIPLSIVGQCNWDPQEVEGEFSPGTCVGNFYLECPLDPNDPTTAAENCSVLGTFSDGKTGFHYMAVE